MTPRERAVLESAARTILADFRMPMAVREFETERLIEMLVQVTADHLENLEHLRLPRRPWAGVL